MSSFSSEPSINMELTSNVSDDDIFVFPASYAQQRMWFLWKLEPTSPVYNIPSPIRLTGPLNLNALEQSIKEIIRRHEVLRTFFAMVDGQLLQAITPDIDFKLHLVDLQVLPESASQGAVQHLINEDAQKPFDLETGPLLRVALIRSSPEGHVLLLTMHHIISDGWSIGVFVRELGQLYQAYLEDEPSPLQELPIQYADFTLWQQERMQGGALDEQLSYWLRQLAGAPEILNLPIDYLRPVKQTFRGAYHNFLLDLDLSGGLKELSRREGATLFMTLLAAFQTLLSRYSGQLDIVVGTPIANRNRTEIEGLIGLFVNTLAIRTDLSGNPTFRELLKRVREGALGAYAHQDLPFEQLVEELRPHRDLSRNPVFQVMFVLQNFSPSLRKIADLEISFLNSDSETAQFDLTLTIWERNNGELGGKLEYNRDLYNSDTIERMAMHLRNLLESIVASPDSHLSDLDILTESERQLLLLEWNATGAKGRQPLCLHELFEDQALRTPEAVAVVFGDEQLTYHELNLRANQLANHLRLLGVGPETLVGLYLERSVELVVGLLGVLKAGGAYLPLDPSYPQERLVFMISDARLMVILVQQCLLAASPSLLESSAHVLSVDSDWDTVALQHKDNHDSGVVPENAAYVIYTSGSTGKPKGVVNTHAGITNRLIWMQETYRLTETDCVLQKTPYSFDVSVWEFFWPLIAGARLVLAVPEGHRDSAYLIKEIAEKGITTLHFVPTMLYTFLEQKELERCQSIKRVICSGEALPSDLQERFFSALDADLHNLYGPTEASVDVTYWPCKRGYQEGSVPIGRPIANIQLYVLDTYMQPVPIGIPGELYIGGIGLARGYLHRPELTAERFLPHPYSKESGVRLYRTGDLARYSANGVLEYLGRVDRQVKLRGYRIELGEIESLLARHPAVLECVVLLREDLSGDKQLVAYVQIRELVIDGDKSSAEQLPSKNQLRQHLHGQLPEYMIPSVFVLLDALPLTPSGKVNHRALPAPSEADLQRANTHGEPRSPIEEILAGIWAAILHLEKVSIYDNFFDVGGQSLLATQMISHVRRALLVDLPLRCVFEAPTIAELAELIRAARECAEKFQAPLIAPVSRNQAFPLSFAQQRLWFLDQLEPGGYAYNVPLAIRMQGRLDIVALERSLQEIVHRHESLRTVFMPRSGGPVQVIDGRSRLEFRIADLQQLVESAREAEALKIVDTEACQPFDLAHGPLIRSTLLRLSQQEHLFLLTLHHIVCDGWSLGILRHELATLYEAFSTGKSPSLSKLPVQYADFAVWQRAWLQGEMLEDELRYWKQQLDGLTPLELPLDRPRPPIQSSRGASKTCQLSEPVTQGLRALAQREGITLFMTLLAALQVLLSRYAGQEDIAVGTLIANRNRDEIEGLIGLFINALVLRTDLSGNPTFRELLSRVREVALEAYTHQDLPFEKLVEHIRPERDMSRSPLFQVLFLLQNAPTPSGELRGLTLRDLKRDRRVANYDITLSITDSGSILHCEIEYNTDLFEHSTIARLLGHWQTILEAIVTDPSQPLADIPLLSADEYQRILMEWNNTQISYSDPRCIHEYFEVQVQRTPDAIAVVYAQEHLTYAELDKRCNQLACHLRSTGVGPGVCVGLGLERSLEMVIGVLGILKAGGAYIPLDPGYPPERLLFMLQQAQIPVLLTRKQYLALFGGYDGQVICLDDERQWMNQRQSSLFTKCASPDDLIYVIYTSGSTGRPKGVGVFHRGVANLLNWFTTEFEITSRDRVLLVTSLSFDLTQKNIFAPLMVGASLYLPSDEQYDPAAIVQAISDYQITLLNCTPSAFYPLLEVSAADGFLKLSSLRCLFLGGEPISLHKLATWRDSEQFQATIINTYGPTECTDIATFHRLPLSEDAEKAVVPIGKPIRNVQVVVVDRHMQPVPPGVVGELCIVGSGVGAGYLNDPPLTALKFVPNPFPELVGERLYRTGDRARYLQDGVIEFLGRVDVQVKLRGHRIELGEIESLLTAHPAIRDCIVLLRKDHLENEYLSAYIVTLGDHPPSIAELRRYLRAQLPDYMLPSAFLQLDALPLTPNGKIDMRALPTPDVDRTKQGLETTFVAPRTPIEEMLAGIWMEVLGIGQLGIRDNFFELGGHSLLATQVISRLHNTFRVDLPLRNLFEMPTVEELARQVAVTLQAEQGGSMPPLEHRIRIEELPLSFAQERLWFLDQLIPNNPVYNLSISAQLSGQISAEALWRSISEIIRRHEALRTTFTTIEGRPVQVISPHQSFVLPVLDLQDLMDEERELEVQRLAAAEAHQPFDLAKGPLVRARLLCLESEKRVLLLTMHHIVSDGWSIGILMNELSILYHAFSIGDASPLSELPIQYADYTLWQRQWLQGEVLESQLSYWKRQLEGIPDVLALPADHPRPAIQTYRGERCSFAVPVELTESIKVLGRREGVTLFMLLLGAFQVLLSRYSGQYDIVVGSPIANRTRTETEGLIGFFANTLVLRTDLSGNPPFQELLRRVYETSLGAYTHQDLPFEQLVEALQPRRNLSHNPLFQVLFVLQNAPTATKYSPHLALIPLETENKTAKFDLCLSITDTSRGLSGELEYNTDLFERNTICQMIDDFQTLLEGIIADPTQGILDLPLLSKEEQQRLLVEWNATGAEYPEDQAVYQLFEAQVERSPDAVAAVLQDEQLTYRELNRRANQLAHHLQKLGVGPEVLVGICVERSLEMVVGLLGILKAGGAYVPLDPAYPQERLAFMLQDAQVHVLLTQERLRTRLPAHRAQVLYLDTTWEILAREGEENPCEVMSPDNLAYVIYTSGSTGTPKGVQILHHAVINFLTSMRQQPGMTERDILLSVTTLSFDIAALELFLPLLIGGRLVLVDQTVITDGLMLSEALATMGATIMQATPATWRLLLLAGWKGENELKLLCGGEALAPELARRLLKGGASLWNLYGPTETTIWSTLAQVKQVGEHQAGSITIGRPIDNTEIYILDGQLQPVPIAVSGDLYIGGAGLARGYLNHPELTAEKFIPHPFSTNPGARLYKTGDVARYLPDGTIEYLGRTDQQVKIRGYRIELGEIETILERHPEIQECAVVAREDTPGDKRLVAYIVIDQHFPPPTTGEFRSMLQRQIPDYMIPSAFHLLKSLPLTPSGKINRQILSVLDTIKPNLENKYVEPRDALEFQMVQIWEEVLGLHSIGVTDNFFELGGHSILAVHLFAYIKKLFGKDLPIATLFQGATIEHLANLLREQVEATAWSPLVPIQPNGSQKPFFCVHPAGGSVNCYTQLARLLGQDQPFYGLQARGIDRGQDPITSIEAMATFYIEAIQVVQPEGPYLLGGWSMGGEVALEMAQQLRSRDQEVTLLALFDTPTPSELAQEQADIEFFADYFGNIPFQVEFLPQWNLEEQITYIWEQAREANKIPPDVVLPQLLRFFQVYKTNEQAVKEYVLSPYLGKITLLHAAEQPDENPLKPSSWSKVAVGGMEVHVIPGNHQNILLPPNVQIVAERLKACLERIQDDC